MEAGVLRYTKAYNQAREAMFSIGFSVGKKGRIYDVPWKGPAFEAGLAPGMKIVSANGSSLNREVLERATAASRESDHGGLTVVTSGSGATNTYVIDFRVACA
ncbi:MAG: hypothetical protein WCB49_12410 [Gammaproteobacteria bacterium]